MCVSSKSDEGGEYVRAWDREEDERKSLCELREEAAAAAACEQHPPVWL